ncbi:MAG: DegV family protein [Oscillospiraceae bacterium]|nr:DegV family protein [Oscillospiraceae bacterium]
MRTLKIVADSSSDVLSLANVDFASAPLKIITNEREFTDNAQLDISEMASFFDSYKGRSHTSCPNPQDWLDAFGCADDVICVTITSALSGSYSAACAAKALYEAEQPERRVFVLDTLSAGPQLRLILEKLEAWSERRSFEDICQSLQLYLKKSKLLFMLKSMNNLANNGRVPKLVAKAAGLAGIHVVGKASDKGTLEPVSKCRGEKRALEAIVSALAANGLNQGKVRISHCLNLRAALKLKEMLQVTFPLAETEIHECRGLCSYYAERGGLLVGFETF